MSLTAIKPAIVQKWCLLGPRHEDIVMPLELKTLDLCSWTSGRAEAMKEDQQFLCLDLGGRAADPWLSRHLGMEYRWWWTQSRQSKVVQDILAEFPCSTLGHAGNKRLGLSQNVAVPIIVKGVELLVLNNRRRLTLVFAQQDPRFEGFLWFLDQLLQEAKQKKDHKGDEKEEDIDFHKEDQEEDNEDDDEDNEHDDEDNEHDDEDNEDEDDDFEELIQQSLESIKAVPGCKRAWWIRSSRRFRVSNVEGHMKDFGVPRKSKIMKRPSGSSSCPACSIASSSDQVEDIVRCVLREARMFCQASK